MEKPNNLNPTKDIRPYLHLYLGCDMLFDESVGKLVGIYCIERSSHNPIIMESDRGVIINRGWHQVKPILRRLSSMSEEESYDLARIYSGTNSVQKTKGVASNFWYFKCYLEEEQDHTLVIDANGEAWYTHYFDDKSNGNKNVVNCHEATRYLLSKGFWLFGDDWFDEGIIIDADTLK